MPGGGRFARNERASGVKSCLVVSRAGGSNKRCRTVSLNPLHMSSDSSRSWDSFDYRGHGLQHDPAEYTQYFVTKWEGIYHSIVIQSGIEQNRARCTEKQRTGTECTETERDRVTWSKKREIDR